MNKYAFFTATCLIIAVLVRGDYVSCAIAGGAWGYIFPFVYEALALNKGMIKNG